MKTSLAFATLLLALSAPMAHAADAPKPASSGALTKAAFDYHCRKCHDVGGTGTFMLGRRLGKDKSLLEARTDLPPDYIRHVVRNGIVSMPWISRAELPNDELDSIVRYLTRNNR